MKNNQTDYRMIFQISPDGMSISRLHDGLFIDVNAGFCEMFGYSRADVIGKTSYELHFWKDFLDRQQIVEKLAKTKVIDNFETVIVNRDGRKVNVMLSVRPFDVGHESCLLISYKNVTAQAQATAALQESEEKFRGMFDTIPDSIIVSDSNGCIHDVNVVFEAITGYSRQEVIGKSTIDIGLWEDMEQREKFLAELAQKGHLQNFEMNVRIRDQQVKFFLVSARLMQIKGESRILSIARDVTFIKSAVQSLSEEEARYRELSLEQRALLEAIPDALILWSDESRVIWANHNAKKYLKTNHEAAIGKTCQELCLINHDHDRCGVYQGFKKGERIQTVEKFVNGEVWDIRAFPLLSADGKVTKVLTLASDITEGLRLREEANRSARLAALGELAAGVAHEINNPTGLILMNTSLVKDVVADLVPLLNENLPFPESARLGGLGYQRALDELPGILTETIESGHRIKQIVEDLKDFSRVVPQDNFEPVDLNEVVRNTLRIMRLAIDKATDNFVVEYAADLPKVLGNARQLEQVVVNLLSNSCQALQDRSESLVVVVSYVAESCESCLRIWDEGCGIEEKVIEQITDPFFTTKRESGGTGLGLSVSSRIIEDHNGRLYFESTPGYGTSVTVLLPAMITE